MDPKSKREIDDAIETITSPLRSSAFKSKVDIPKATAPKKAPWWNQKLYQTRQQLRFAQQELRRSPETPLLLSNVHEIKASYQREIRRAKTAYWIKFCSEELNKTTPSRL